MCKECKAFVDPSDQAPAWWVTKRFSESPSWVHEASRVWASLPYVESAIARQIYRAWKRT